MANLPGGNGGAMRILQVIPGLTHERGGPTTVVWRLTRHQAEAGHDIACFTPTRACAQRRSCRFPFPAGSSLSGSACTVPIDWPVVPVC